MGERTEKFLKEVKDRIEGKNQPVQTIQEAETLEIIRLSEMTPSARMSFQYLHPQLIEKQPLKEESKPLISNIKASETIFKKVKLVLKKYLDTSELNYNLLTVWILGTYFHNQFETYPLLTLMARKQSGKTRTLKLVSTLSSGSDGSVSTSITETHLFRHKAGAIFFDEMESISSKEKTALRETINSVYKKGNKIVRYKEATVNGSKTYVEENFYPFYPLGLANINGFGDVLADRSLQLILQRSSRKHTKLIEDFSTNQDILSLKESLSKVNTEIPKNLFSEWNEFIQTGKTGELSEMFEQISKIEMQGRPLEIFFPLFIVAKNFGVLPTILECAKEYMKLIEGDYSDNIDDLLNEFIATVGGKYLGFTNLSLILQDFRASLEQPEEWINAKWFGRALKRLGLIKQKRYIGGHSQIELNINSTNSTNTTNTTNTTNSTNSTKQDKSVELVESVELVDIVDLDKKKGNILPNTEKLCFRCHAPNGEVFIDGFWFCPACNDIMKENAK